MVRCQLASTARRLPASQALPLVSAVVARDADAADAYIPLLCWWTIESHCDTARDAIVDLFSAPAVWKQAVARQFILPRLIGFDPVGEVLNTVLPWTFRAIFWLAGHDVDAMDGTAI